MAATFARRSTRALLAFAFLAPLVVGAGGASRAVTAPPTVIEEPSAAGSGAAQGSYSGPLVVVMDLSGSMNESDSDGVVKLEGAKSALMQLVAGQPRDTELGVWTYPGGRDDEDGCASGAWAVGADVAPVNDPAALAAQIDLLRADGDTPTGPALIAATNRLKSLGYDSATLLLVSDGESNCGTPPCDVAKAVVSEGFDVTVDALGFRLSPQGQAEMTCVAGVTGGRYVAAEDTAELREYLTTFAVPSLAVSVTAPTNVVVGQEVVLEARVSNPSSRPVLDSQVSLTFTDDNSQAIFPAVLPPRFRLGNLTPGASVRRNWRVRAGVDLTGGNAAFRVTAWGVETSATTLAVSISVRAGTDLAAAAGTWLGQITRSGRVVVLGDSYSSGEGAPPYVAGTDRSDNRCHRSVSTHTLPQFSRERRTLLACSGAVIADLYNGQQLNGREQNAAQLDQLRDLKDPPDLAVLTLGGNDIGFSGIVTACLGPGDCSSGSLRTKAPTDIADLNVHARGELGRLSRAYRDVYAAMNSPRQVDRRGGVAPLLVLPYPQVLPATASARCGGFSGPETQFARGLIMSLNRTIERAVADAARGGLGIFYVTGAESAMQPNHTACDPENYIRDVNLASGAFTKALDAWLASQAAKFRGDDYPSLAQQFMHPNESGYRATTIALYSWSSSVSPDLAGLQPYKAPAVPDVVKPPWNLTSNTVRPGRPANVAAGDRVRIRANDIPQHATVTIAVTSTRRALSTTRATARGAVDAQILIPADLSPGRHTLHLEYVDGSEVVTQTVPIRLRPATPLWLIGVAALTVLSLATLVAAHSLGRRSRTLGQSFPPDEA